MMTMHQNTDPVNRLNRLYALKQAQLEKARENKEEGSLHWQVLSAEADAISRALRDQGDSL
jgi:hypothetical protein